MQFLLVAALLALTACAPRACSDEDNLMARDLEIMLGEPGAAADAAELRLTRQGRAAIVILETGLYNGDTTGRRRIVRALERIAAPEAIPLLAHLAAHDPDVSVREAAKDALNQLSSAP